MAKLGICRQAPAESFPNRESTCEQAFTARKLSAIHSVSDNGWRLDCEDELFAGSETARLGGINKPLADIQSTPHRFLSGPISQCIAQAHHRQSEPDLLGFDLGGAPFNFPPPLLNRARLRKGR